MGAGVIEMPEELKTIIPEEEPEEEVAEAEEDEAAKSAFVEFKDNKMLPILRRAN